MSLQRIHRSLGLYRVGFFSGGTKTWLSWTYKWLRKDMQVFYRNHKNKAQRCSICIYKFDQMPAEAWHLPEPLFQKYLYAQSGPRYLHSNPTRGSTDRLCLLSTQDISKFWPLQSNQWNAKIWLTTKWWFFYKKISLNPPISLQKTAKKLSVDDLSPFRSVMETAIPTQKSPWKWLSHPENRFWHRFYHGFGSETKKPLKMIFAPWKSFLVPFLPWLWLRNKKALENDFRTLKIVWGTISTMALVSKQRSPWKWFSHPENRFWHRFYHGLPRNNKKDWTRTGSNRFAQRTEPNRTVTTWNRTEPIHFTNRTADIPVSQNRNEPNRTGGFLILGFRIKKDLLKSSQLICH